MPSCRLTLLGLLTLCSLSGAPTPAHAQSVEVRAAQLEFGVDGVLPLAATNYDHTAGLGGGLVVRVALTRGRFVFDAGLVGQGLTVNERWFQGDIRWLTSAYIVRVRAMFGVRYALISGEHAQLYARVAAGFESRVSRYVAYVDDPSSRTRTRDLSWAPVVEPGLGLRLGGAKTFALVQVALPLAIHHDNAIRLHGNGGRALAVDLSVSLLLGVTL